jgi:stage III sporulation protein AE
LQNFSGLAKYSSELVTIISISILLIQPSNTFIQLAAETIRSLCEYEKRFLPVMASAMAAEGGVTTSTALYSCTAALNTLLSTGIANLIIPLSFLYMALCVTAGAVNESTLGKLRDFFKWLMTWSLKIVIYVFTGYIGITGVISGTADASAIKAAKIAISGFVPVVGGIISDASETILVSARVMKNAAGLYGLLAILAVWISPFLQIGTQYILLKITSAVCSGFGSKRASKIMDDFSGLMGFMLAITSTVCLLLLVSTVCFVKGISL